MKIKNYFMMLLVILCALACSDDDDVVNPSDVITGTYNGYSWTEFFGGAYTMLDEGESVSMVSNTDGTVAVTYNSSTWGNVTIPAATVTTGTGGYTLDGTGSAVMANHNTGASTTYVCDFTGTVSADKSDAELVFSLPAVMSGTTITFRLGSAPDYMAVNGTYTVYTAARVMGMSLVNNNETVKLTADTENETAVLSYEGTWGTGTTTALTLTKTNGAYAFTGSGSIAASMPGSTTNAGTYSFTVEGTLSADKTILSATFSIVLGGMGTVVVEAASGYAPAASFLADSYDGYTSAVFTYSSTPVVTDGENVTISGNDDGTIKVVLTSNQWGTSTITEATVEVSEEGVYTFSGKGTSLMGMSGSEAREYECTLAGIISADKENVEINISLSIMGGTTITFRIGEAPAEGSGE